MPKYNDMFELTVEDMVLIEAALRRTMGDLSQMQLEFPDEVTSDNEETVRRIHELLGRLHNQCVFYRPKDGVYVGG
ncbi:hypothetical protein [Parasedimentitalea psychrophila]|uniref:Uncharacterized protein n=1 Tax=Parasedimentitalea psychrophila TaxID=2997337 RepID=A0A9Y2P074_9RHOB|nr:hypothetical protein [Parasedimentitalea psychrophila]WIY24316.1 hypothetical protein QPJ95_17190 [Parasedimentitalea psychrophila]